MKLINSHTQTNSSATMTNMTNKNAKPRALASQRWHRSLWLSCCILTLMFAGGCASTAGQVSQDKIDAVTEMKSALTDAYNKVNQYCGEGTQEAAAAMDARHLISKSLEEYQGAARSLTNTRTVRINQAQNINALDENIKSNERKLSSLTNSEPVEFDHQWTIPSQEGNRIASESHAAMERATKELETLRSSQNATPEQIAEAQQIVDDLRRDDAQIDTYNAEFIQAWRDGDRSKMDQKYQTLAEASTRMSAGALKIELMNQRNTLATRREVIAVTDNNLQADQNAYDQKKEALDDAMAKANEALKAARAKAVEGAGTDTIADGTPIFPSLPGDWNSTFWDISSP